MTRQIPRRDRVFITAKRAGSLDTNSASKAWFYLCGYLEKLGGYDHLAIPKFNDMLRAIRKATIYANDLKRLYDEQNSGKIVRMWQPRQ